MKRKVCFLFISPGCAESPREMVMDMGASEMIMVGVGSYETACQEAVRLVQEGVILIELCGGFGSKGQAMVTEAVDSVVSPVGKVWVGAVRFDNHPGYEHQSGDQRWLV